MLWFHTLTIIRVEFDRFLQSRSYENVSKSAKLMYRDTLLLLEPQIQVLAALQSHANLMMDLKQIVFFQLNAFSAGGGYDAILPIVISVTAVFLNVFHLAEGGGGGQKMGMERKVSTGKVAACVLNFIQRMTPFLPQVSLVTGVKLTRAAGVRMI